MLLVKCYYIIYFIILQLQYLYENEDKVYIDVNSMADELRKKYREYRDQKRELFRHRVRKVYEDLAKTLSESSDNYDGAEDEGDNVKIEVSTFDLTLKFF